VAIGWFDEEFVHIIKIFLKLLIQHLSIQSPPFRDGLFDQRIRSVMFFFLLNGSFPAISSIKRPQWTIFLTHWAVSIFSVPMRPRIEQMAKVSAHPHQGASGRNEDHPCNGGVSHNFLTRD